MTRLPRFGSALSALALAGVVVGCAGPTRQGHTINLNKSNVGLAMKAQLALAAGDFGNAASYAEQAVENLPQDAGLRVLLGNTYFGSGRFASAESAYRDALALQSNQPQTILKLALAQIAQGENQEAIAFLNAARDVLEPADYGLAIALAGEPGAAINVLEPAARTVGADARTRQNLALALGLSGDWEAARTVAAQDLSADQVDARVRQWMALAKPTRPSDQVAALIGITPAATDPGQPTRLALRDANSRLAAAEPAPVVEAAPVDTATWTPPAALPPMAAAEPVEVAAAEPQSLATAFQAPDAEAVVTAAAIPVEVAPPPLVAAMGPEVGKKRKVPLRTAATPRAGKAGVVVQLGAFRSSTRVETAWEQFSERHDALQNFTPTSAKFDGPQGTVYRLSVRGFSSVREAQGLCSSLRAKGQACFVRHVAGDAPVQFASRG